MRVKKVFRGSTITFTVTDAEKIAIAQAAERDKRTISGYIRSRLNDILESVKEESVKEESVKEERDD